MKSNTLVRIMTCTLVLAIAAPLLTGCRVQAKDIYVDYEAFIEYFFEEHTLTVTRVVFEDRKHFGLFPQHGYKYEIGYRDANNVPRTFCFYSHPEGSYGSFDHQIFDQFRFASQEELYDFVYQYYPKLSHEDRYVSTTRKNNYEFFLQVEYYDDNYEHFTSYLMENSLKERDITSSNLFNDDNVWIRVRLSLYTKDAFDNYEKNLYGVLDDISEHIDSGLNAWITVVCYSDIAPGRGRIDDWHNLVEEIAIIDGETYIIKDRSEFYDRYGAFLIGRS